MHNREYKTIKALRRGETIDFEGIKLKMDTDANGDEVKVKKGDLYIAERNTGPKFLTAEKIVPWPIKDSTNKHGGWIQPTTLDYSFDLGECVKVVEVNCHTVPE